MYSMQKIADIVKGKLILQATSDANISRLIIDSRNIISPTFSLFFALQSSRNDGHKYLEDVQTKGVRNFIVSKIPANINKFKNSNFILVDNTLNALQTLCAYHRKKFHLPVIGITGSNGKTIIKEWLFQLMSLDKNIVRSPKSFNSQIGVPLSVWQIEPEHELALFEAGISLTDEMEKLQKIIRPTIGVFTNIGQAHDENFIDHKQKIKEKLKLFKDVKYLVYCSDHKEIEHEIKKTSFLKKTPFFSWSKKQSADLKIIKISTSQQGSKIQGVFKKKSIEIFIPFTDEASIENAIHCWAVLLLLGYKNNIIRSRMKKLAPVAMRLELKEGINNCSIINDSYNSDINSLSIALDFLTQQKQHKKKTVILSDILQSGKDENELYKNVAQMLADKRIDRIIGIGKSISKHKNKFLQEKNFYSSTDDFLKNYSSLTFADETILLKGARIFCFENISYLLQQKLHETILEINLNALTANLNYYRSLLKTGTKVMAMVKAFSYGSGSFEIANILQYHHVDYLAVAFADEGVELRKTGINLPIIVMNPEQESIETFFKYQLEPEIYNFRTLELFSKTANDKKIKIPIHIKIDTGMHRLGFEVNVIDILIENLKKNKYLKVQSIFSHLASSDDPAQDNFTKYQIKLFKKISNKIKSEFNENILLHIANSSAISRFPEAHFDMVRLGIGLYGISNSNEEQIKLQNVSTLKTSISQIKKIKKGETIGYNRKGVAAKDTTIAIIPIGYADGLSRILSNGKGKVMIKGKTAPIIGNICMDMCMIDISKINAVEGDEVIIFGTDYSINNIAEQSQTIPYEILTGISRRVKRIYFQE